MDFEFVNRPWSKGKVRSLVLGVSFPDSGTEDGYADVPSQSWYQLRCAAYDRGDVNALFDAIQLEWAIDEIDDGKVRAAVTLALHGWGFPEIGAAVGGRRTGEQLVLEGISVIAALERGRA